jgi:DNA-binding GntR family transcriptional regulator
MTDVMEPDRLSLHSDVAGKLRDMIIRCELPPGERVHEHHFGQLFGVSRTPLREALKILASEGLIEIRPNRGSVVAPISFEEISHTFEVMGALEELAGFLVCDRVSNVDIAALEQLMQEMHSTHDNIDRDQYADLNFAFHRKIIELSGNCVLVETYNNFFGKLQRARYCVNYHKARWDESVREHEAIMDALRRRDGAELSKRLKEHNARTGIAVLARLRSGRAS